jgi:hypothetical protein
MDKRGGACGGGGARGAKRMCKEWAPPADHPRWGDRHALHLLLALGQYTALKMAYVRVKIAGYTCHVGLEKQQRAIGAVKRDMDATFTMRSACKLYVLNLAVSRGHFTSRLIPSEIGFLPRLQGIWSTGSCLCPLNGAMPTEIGQLIHLRWMFLGGNRLTGKIPTEVGRLENLLDMQLEDNQLAGAIPTEIGQLTKLRELRLSRNQLTGRVPTELERCSRLQGLTLSENQLTGKVPTLVQLLGSTWRALKPR